MTELGKCTLKQAQNPEFTTFTIDLDHASMNKFSAICLSKKSINFFLKFIEVFKFNKQMYWNANQ